MIDHFIDRWCSFKTEAEFAQCKMGLFKKQKHLLMQEKKRYSTIFQKQKELASSGLSIRAGSCPKPAAS